MMISARVATQRPPSAGLSLVVEVALESCGGASAGAGTGAIAVTVMPGVMPVVMAGCGAGDC